MRGKTINAYNELVKLSFNKEFIAIDNDSFILIKDDSVHYYGNVYMIKNEMVEKLQNIGVEKMDNTAFENPEYYKKEIKKEVSI